MTFETLGSKEKPAVILIHGMMCSAKSCMPFGKEMSDEYFVIMPTLDGHGDDGTDLLTVDKEAQKIIDYLKQNDIDDLAMIQGSSMGAEVALEVTRQAQLNGIKTDISFFDGGPFFHFTPWFRALMRMRFTKLTGLLDTDDPDQAVETLKKNKFVQFVAKDKIEQYGSMFRSLVSERRSFSKKTIENMVNICYKCDLPVFDKEKQKRLIFFFGKSEPAIKSKKRLMKAYPDADFRVLDGYGHCGLQILEPARYSKMLKECIESKRSL
ncbi:MAG: alpha/beta hydrolase [Lachnospiraceae bacterium]|nr:alpha/beta hydrolase [Lachnospiraceae bacterium]